MIIHVGLHKTATTFLQREIFPKVDIDIVSYEGLSGNPVSPYSYVNSRYELLNVIAEINSDVEILLTLRDKKEWLKSLYSQYLKQGGCMKFQEYNRKFDKEFLNFERYITELKKRFKIVHVVWYNSDMNVYVNDICNSLSVDVPIFRNKIYNKGYSEKESAIVRNINSMTKAKLKSRLSGRYIVKWLRNLKLIK